LPIKFEPVPPGAVSHSEKAKEKPKRTHYKKNI
jgi:hypothetical protein